MPKYHSATFLQSITAPGKYRVDPGLYLSVSGAKGTSKTWVFRYQLRGGRHDAGLGPYPAVTVTEAKKRALLAREQVRAGLDPIKQRRAAALPSAPVPTFLEMALEWQEKVLPTGLNPKTVYRASLLLGARYCGQLHGKPISEIRPTDLASMLRDVAEEKPETARKLHGFLRKVFVYSRVVLRDRHNLELTLPVGSDELAAAGYVRTRKSVPHPALDWREAPAFMDQLAARPGIVTYALQLLILTGLRESAVTRAEWSEFDVGAAVWTVPLERLKDREHRTQPLRVPLSTHAQAILRRLKGLDPKWVFPGARPNEPLSPQSLLQALKLRINRTPEGRTAWTDPDSQRPIGARHARNFEDLWRG
jgi:integrase